VYLGGYKDNNWGLQYTYEYNRPPYHLKSKGEAEQAHLISKNSLRRQQRGKGRSAIKLC